MTFKDYNNLILKRRKYNLGYTRRARKYSSSSSGKNCCLEERKKLKSKKAWYLLKISKNVFYHSVKEYEPKEW